jgi:hypothetical protein
MEFLSNEVARVNEFVDSNIFKGDFFDEPVPLPSILDSIINQFPADVVEMVLGKRGTGLLAFKDEVDLQHPDLTELLPNNEISILIRDSLELGAFAMSKKLASAPCVPKYIQKKARSYLRGVDNPHHFIRLFKDEDRRIAERNKKNNRQIDMHKNYVGGPAHGFKMFVRYSDSYKEEYDNACRMMERYEKLGATVLQETIKKTIDGFDKAFDDSHLGFHRITLTNAAVILANIHGCTFYRGEIIFPTALVSKGSRQKKYRKSYYYSPRAYPYHELLQLSSPRIKKIINHLEHLPEKKGKPVFDHYIVVVPGMKLHGEYAKKQNSMATDVEMIMEDLIFPILVGERDGKCYFISYWTHS